MLTLLINLDDATDRLSEATNSLKQAGIPFRRIEAVDGRGRPSTDFPEYVERNSIRFYGRPMTSGEIGCYLSHLKSVAAFLATDEQFCLVLEDDMTMPEDGAKIIADLISSLEHQKRPWEVVNLGKAAHKFKSKIATLNGYNVELAHYFPTTTTGLLWNRQGAQAFLDTADEIYAPVDHFFRRFYSVRGTGVALSPALTVPSGAESMIDAEGVAENVIASNKARKRIPRRPQYFFREFRRQSVNYLGALRGLLRTKISR